MRHFIACFFLLMSFGLIANDAFAGRFGGGRSFGVQRSHSSLFSPRATPNNTKAFNQRPNSNRWAGPLAGLMMGGLLASLFMGHGLGAGLLSWLALGALVFFVMGFLKKRMAPVFQSPLANPFRQSTANNTLQFYTATQGNASTTNHPAGFDETAFLRAAKVTFVYLQSAYDQDNRQDLSEFTAPDVFAEIKMQLNERGDTPNITETNELEATLLDVSKQAQGTMASVRFTGWIKENNNPPIKLDEIWHFRQFGLNSAWVVAGIQQEVWQPE